VTLQTLHAEKFDHGLILDQTPYPGVDIPNVASCTVPELVNFVGQLGAEMLVRGIRNRIFIPPIEDRRWYKGVKMNGGGTASGSQNKEQDDPANLRLAPKITPEDRHINWGPWTGDAIVRRNRVLGPLWNTMRLKVNGGVEKRRIILSNLKKGDVGSDQLPIYKTRLPFVEIDIANSVPSKPAFSGPLMVKTSNGDIIEIGELKVEGSKGGEATAVAAKASLFSSTPIYVDGESGQREFREFKDVLG
jgi:methionyl-tRNA formyltransferase